MRELHAVLARTEGLRPAPDPVTAPVPEDAPPPYLRRDDYDDMHRLCLGLWPLRTRELLQVIDGVERMTLDVLRAAERGATMQECAARLYPAQLFIRFFHDTIGVCGVDTIRRFCPDAPPLPTPGDAPGDAPGKTSAKTANETSEATPDGATNDTPQPPVAPPSAGKRVLLACNFFWPSVGGTELFIETLGLHLRALGHHVEIACRWQENRASEIRHGMPIRAFRCHGKFTDPTMGPDTERYRALVRNGGYDAVIVLAHPDNWACHLLADLPQPHPRIIMLPSINAENMEHWAERGVLDDIARTLRAADVCVAVSENGHDSRLFTELGVPQAFVPHAMDPAPAPWDMRARLGLPRDVPLLACVGNFWPVKNQLALLRRLADAPPDALSDGTPDWRLVLAGGALPWEKERRYFEECWQLARHNPRVRMLGPLPPEEATALIRDADLLLVPSQGESAGPLVVLEAMALGTPWVATPQCNAVHDEGGGVIAPLEDFPRIIGRLLARPDLADELARNGRAHWERCFRWATVAPLFDALVRNGSIPAGARMPDDLRTARQRLADAVLGA
ncbi:glycosyltransferase family 4 protein [Desulfovibrio sp. XJ01]|nr:glycosyltransferase family 4 protein [Nitratidesulfovibrio liaohensis]